MSWEIRPEWEATLGLAGAVAALALFLSPIPTFQRIVAKKSTEEFPSFPYVSTFLNCFIWTFYCLPSITPGRASPLVTNGCGLVIQTAFLVVFVLNAKDAAKATVKQQLTILGAFLVLLVALVMGVLAPDHRSPFLGFVATTFTVVMFASPLSSLGIVLRTQSVEYMPLPLSLMGLACSFTWTFYGVYVRDYFVIIPNALGVVLGLVQLAIYYYISNGASKKGSGYERVQAEEEIALAEVGEGGQMDEK